MPLFGTPNVEALKFKGNMRGLIRALAYKKDAEVRKMAAYELGWGDYPRAVKPLIAALNDREVEVRKAAAFALGVISDPEAVDALIDALNDGNEMFMAVVATALGDIGDKRALEPIQAAFESKNQPTEVYAARGRLGDHEVVGALINAMKADPSLDVIKALGAIRDPAAVPVLLEYAGTEKSGAWWAVNMAHKIQPGLTGPKFRLVACFSTIRGGTYTLVEHNLTKAEYEQFKVKRTVRKINLDQTYEHAGLARGCRACENIIRPYVKERSAGTDPVRYDLGDGSLHYPD